MLRLTRIDVHRSGGWLILVLVALAAAATDLRFVLWDTGREGSLAPSWFRITAVGTVIVGTYPLVAAYGGWLGSRSHRNATLELEGIPKKYWVGGSAPAMTAMWIWIGIATILIYAGAATYTWLRARAVSGEAPAGSVPWQSSLVILSAMIAMSSLGYLIGRLFPGKMVPVLAAALAFFLFQIRDMVVDRRVASHWLDAIIPTNLTQAMSPFIGDRVYPELFWYSLLWFGSLSFVCIGIQALWRNRKILPAAFLFFAIFVAVFAGVNVIRAFNNSGTWHAQNRGVRCISHIEILFCAPPDAMDESSLAFIANQYEKQIPAWFPESRIPDRLVLQIGNEPVADGATPLGNFTQSNRDMGLVRMNAAVPLITGVPMGSSIPTTSQLVVACAMLLDSELDCGQSYPDDRFQKVPDASQSLEGQAIFASTLESGEQPSSEDQLKMESEIESLQSLTQEKLDNFVSLSDQQKEAWLDANWDRLRSGELTLDEMP